MRRGAEPASSVKDGPPDIGVDKREKITRAARRTFSCSEGSNLSGFKSLLPNSNLNINPGASRHHTLNLNETYCSRVSSTSPPPPTVYSLTSVRIPKVCVDVWPVVYLFPATWIDTEQPSRQSIPRKAGSINISYVQLSQTVRAAVDCINSSQTQDAQAQDALLCYSSSHWSYKCVNCFYICIEWMCLLFLYQCQTEEEAELQGSKVTLARSYWQV